MGRKKVIKDFDPEQEGIKYEDNEGLPLPGHLNNEDGSLDNETWLRGKNKKVNKDKNGTKRRSRTN